MDTQQSKKVGATQTELKRLDLSANSFEANGTRYLIHSSLSVERFKKFEELQIIAGFGSDYPGIMKQVTKAYDLLNKGKLADASVVLHNIMNGIIREQNKQEHPLLLIATLFVITDNEDARTWDETRAAEKIADWNTEGIDSQDFFRLAFRLSEQYILALRDHSLTSSTDEEAE